MKWPIQGHPSWDSKSDYRIQVSKQGAHVLCLGLWLDPRTKSYDMIFLLRKCCFHFFKVSIWASILTALVSLWRLRHHLCHVSISHITNHSVTGGILLEGRTYQSQAFSVRGNGQQAIAHPLPRLRPTSCFQSLARVPSTQWVLHICCLYLLWSFFLFQATPAGSQYLNSDGPEAIRNGWVTWDGMERLNSMGGGHGNDGRITTQCHRQI